MNYLSKIIISVISIAIVFIVSPVLGGNVSEIQYSLLESENFNFRIEYPENLKIEEVFDFRKADTKYGAYFYKSENLDESEHNHNFPYFSMLVIDNPNNLSVEKWIAQKLDPVFIREINDIEISGQNAVRVLEEGEVDHYIFIFDDNNLLFLISTPIFDEQDKSYQKILNSFTLLSISSGSHKEIPDIIDTISPVVEKDEHLNTVDTIRVLEEDKIR